MPEIENKLNEMGYELPPPRAPGAGNIIPWCAPGTWSSCRALARACRAGECCIPASWAAK